MPSLVLIGLVAIIIWSLVSHRFERWGVAGPVGLMLLGAIAVIWDPHDFTTTLDSQIAEKVVEIILAILLFVDATEVKGGIFGGEGRIIARLVLVGLPLSIVLTVVGSAFLVDTENLGLLVLLACIMLPTDFAPAAQLLRNRALPERTRQILNVESGYNDGLISPLFSMALAVTVLLDRVTENADGTITIESGDDAVVERFTDMVEAFMYAVPATALAILIGLLVGLAIGYLVRVARRHEIASAVGARYIMLLVPLVAYGIAMLPALEANGFIASFVAGVGYRIMRTRTLPDRTIDHSELLLVDEVGALTSYFVWFVLGGVAVVVFTSGIDGMLVLLALLALTLLRVLPVYVSLLGSRMPQPDRWTIGVLGPRGTATIVFGLLAYNALDGESADAVLTVMLVTVVGSIVLHGFVAPYLVRRVYRTSAAVTD